MSDDQIRDLFQTAETWSPHNVDGADAADEDSSASISSPNATLPPLQLGSDVEIAGCVAQYLRQKRGEVIFSEGALCIMPCRIGGRSPIMSCVWLYTGSTAQRSPVTEGP